MRLLPTAFFAALLIAQLGCGRHTEATHAGHAQASAKHVHWSYSGEAGPANWGKLDPEYALCATGTKQSPIDIVSPTQQDLPDIIFEYKPSAVTVVNNGHTVQVNYQAGSSITIDGTVYKLAQFHFHAPSEHTIKGKHAAAEMHLVHKSDAGGLAVVGAMIVEGSENPAFAPVWTSLPATSGGEASASVDVSALLPSDRRTIRYDGSLTTPPGTEGVRWNLLVEPVALSKAQLDAFTKLYLGNNRPVQSLNGRTVVQDTVAR